MLMDDIATQRETSRKSIRYEAHKFRQKNNRYYNHPLGACAEMKATSVNIAPPNWKPPNARVTIDDTRESIDSDDNDDENDVTEYSPRQRGIITRAKKPNVSFSVTKEVHQIEDDLEIDDLENTQLESSQCQQNKHTVVRSASALQYRDRPEIHVINGNRQQSALPAVRTSTIHGSDGKSTNGAGKAMERPHTVNVCQDRGRECYFDKSKAAYQLRQDLRKRAKLRKQGVKASVFTLQDAINLEKENFLKNKDKIVDYVRRLEALKKSESDVVNKWTRNAIVNQLNI